MALQPRERKYVLILVGTIMLAVAAQWLVPEPLDWSWSLERDDTRPYGSTVAFDLLPSLFPGANVDVKTLPPYLALRDTTVTDVNYLFLTQSFEPDPAEVRALLSFAERGNTVFIGAATVRGALADSLDLRTDIDPTLPAQLVGDNTQDSLGVNFVNPRLRADSAWTFRRGAADRYVEAFDTTRATVLGINSEEQVNFLQVDVGAGRVFIHLVPLAFTNYHLLHARGAEYATRSLSYLPVRTTWWDAHYKPGRSQASTPLRFILTAPALRWAYYLLIGGVLLFMLVEAKRRQRIIPVIEPPSNDSLQFVRTVGRLYHQHGDHAALARKRITYFLDYVRSHLNVPTGVLDADLAGRIAERSGLDEDHVRGLLATIRQVRDQESLTEDELHALNDQIEYFYRHSRR